MYGIKGYNPKFYSNCKDFLAYNRNIIKQLIGQQILQIFWVWDNFSEKWFKDYPVVMLLSGGQYSFCADRHSDFAIGFENIDLNKKPVWNGSGDYDLVWKEYTSWRTRAITNKNIDSIEIVNFLPQFISDYAIPSKKENRIYEKFGFLHGIGFYIDGVTMVVLNGLDDNNIAFYNHDFPNYYTRIIIND